MAFAVATQILVDGPRNTVAKITGDFSGATFANTTIITASSLSAVNPGMSGSPAPTLLRIDHIDYSISDGVIAQLQWHATTNVVICELYGRGKLEARMFGGYQNNAGAGVTGDIDLAVVASSATAPTESSVLFVIHTVKYHASI
jgi:hypothetical protein